LGDNDLAYDLEQKTDARGSLAEFVKSLHIGQVLCLQNQTGDNERQPLPPYQG